MLLLAALFLAATLLAACADDPSRGGPFDAGDAADAAMATPNLAKVLAEPLADEVVVIINNNAAFGNHAGLFVGDRLSDPAGSYRKVRAWTAGWKRPTLNDYIAYQRVDGERVETYRFRVASEVLEKVAERLPEADHAAPLFCGAGVNNAIAGIGPFAGIEKRWWVSPATLAAALSAIIAADPQTGACLLPDGSSCR